ncbi:MAG TPA: murein biosynthesis integral membrane protein MurJ [Bryobacteraceae bacterium]|nr:murein biosynthesis integral membrane protein MurJ [Bryobacteraceae bacterium]
MAQPQQRESSGRHAFLVAAGILISRIFGLVRQRYFNKYFGLYDTADAFQSAMKVPNFLQNLFGEGVLSASFIPVYARLLAEGDEKEAGRVAGAVFAILTVATSAIVLLGVLAAPYLMWAIAGGFHGEKRELTILLVRILFPAAGLLVCSAWCLGILNSHRKFFLSYAAPVVWNLALIATLILFHRAGANGLAIRLAWGTVLGSALQFGVQLPEVLRLVRKLRPVWDTRSEHIREIVRNFAPVSVSRGVVQISAWVDLALATWLPEGAVAGMQNAQSIYMLPVSLFGMAVSAAELPAMSSTLGDPAAVAAGLRRRLDAGLRQIAFFIVPSAMAFFAFGDVITAALYESGLFTHRHSQYVWGIVAGSAVGLLASTLGRLYASTYYALRDTRTPLRYAVIRVTLTTVLGLVCALLLPGWMGLEPKWGAAGLTASAGFAGWVEFTLLRRGMNRRIGVTGVPAALVAKLWASAAVGAAIGWGIKVGWGAHLATGRIGLIVAGAAILVPYGLVYFGVTWLLGVEECASAFRRFARLRR